MQLPDQQTTDQRHRVLGQLVLTLRAERLLDGARDVGYRVDDRMDAIVVDWTAGPHPREVAAGLAEWSARVGDTAARPAGSWFRWPRRRPRLGVTIEAARSSVVAPDQRAALNFNGTRVVLSAYDSIGMQHARTEYARNAYFHPHRPSRRIWPSPLEDDGAWLDSVLWDRDHRHGLVATVVRAPIDLHRDMSWIESGYGVALAEQDMPATVGADRRYEISQFRRSGCSILLRTGRNWSLDEADDWMTAILDDAWQAPSSVAVLWHDRCVMRYTSGLRLDVTCDGQWPTAAPWSHVPSALLNALIDAHPSLEPPRHLKVRAYGQQFTIASLTIDSTWVTPSRHYIARTPHTSSTSASNGDPTA
ncbi:MAG: hypothetical protein QOF58_3254 [Pseudonocardiales bacterium]|jgi:hypothetical protein|nr:hypothetical protein [Pseudonocardiales bacterium]